MSVRPRQSAIQQSIAGLAALFTGGGQAMNRYYIVSTRQRDDSAIDRKGKSCRAKFKKRRRNLVKMRSHGGR